MKNIARRFVYLLVLAFMVGAIAYGFKPQPVSVDVETVSTGPMMVTV